MNERSARSPSHYTHVNYYYYPVKGSVGRERRTVSAKGREWQSNLELGVGFRIRGRWGGGGGGGGLGLGASECG